MRKKDGRLDSLVINRKLGLRSVMEDMLMCCFEIIKLHLVLCLTCFVNVP